MRRFPVWPLAAVLLSVPAWAGEAGKQVTIDASDPGRTFQGIGALSAGDSSRLLRRYPPKARRRVLDLLFKPKYGASLQHLKVEIGSGVNSTCGTEPTHARTERELREPKPRYYRRGYEWWLMERAKRRNPTITLGCLAWGAPGWVGDGVFYSRDSIDYILAFLRGARKYHDLRMDYVGGWNEHPYDTAWLKELAGALDDRGMGDVQLVAADTHGWDIADRMRADPELMRAVDVIGAHYPARRGYTSSAAARKTGKPLWNSEDGFWHVDRGEGNPHGHFAYTAKMLNRDYIEGRMTKQVIWSLVTSYYDWTDLPGSGLLRANEPWSGHFRIKPVLWAVAHTTQFAQPGWRYLNSGCGDLEGGGSYVTLRDPDHKGDFSIIVETMEAKQPSEVTFRLGSELAGERLAVRKSTAGGPMFVETAHVTPENGRFTLTLAPDSIYSLTTTTGQRKASPNSAASEPFPRPYRTGFEQVEPGRLPRYFANQRGVFVVRPRADGQGRCMKQVLRQQGIQWNWNDQDGSAFVQTLLGDAGWKDYEVSASFRICENTGAAVLLGRLRTLRHRGARRPSCYWLKVRRKWKLFAGDELLASGRAEVPAFEWHRMKLAFQGDRIRAFLDGRQVAEVTDDRFARGVAGVGCGLGGFRRVAFDNFRIE